jgi:hypothetical protein
LTLLVSILYKGELEGFLRTSYLSFDVNVGVRDI